MGLDFGAIPWSKPRGWKLVLLTLTVLTLLLAVPLYQLGDHDRADYYKQYLYQSLSKYLDHGGVYNNTLYHDGANGDIQPQFNFSSSPCDGFPDLTGITLVMKTGGTEAYEKMPMHLLTSIQCMRDDDYLFFSDLEQQIGKYHLYNVLENVDPQVKQQGRLEFDLYDMQITCPVSQKDCMKEPKGAWELDKYKFLHMVERTWELRPGSEWYVFAEADSYVFWPNLVHWIRNKANATATPYVGSVTYVSNMPFAHGGSGYVLSGETVRRMMEIPNLAAKYDAMAPHECCGDYLMALAADETGVRVTQAHPMFNGEKPNTLPYGNGHWCEPLLTMHHMNSEEVSSVWQYEQTRTNKNIVQIKDMYETFFAPNLISRRIDWDNLSDDDCYVGPTEENQVRATEHQRSRQKAEGDKSAVQRRAHLSPSSCAKVCEAEGLDINHEEYEQLLTDEQREAMIKSKFAARSLDKKFRLERQCFQWRYNNGACCTARSFKQGRVAAEGADDESKRWTSGWFVDGINGWIAAKGQCEPEWKELS